MDPLLGEAVASTPGKGLARDDDVRIVRERLRPRFRDLADYQSTPELPNHSSHARSGRSRSGSSGQRRLAVSPRLVPSQAALLTGGASIGACKALLQPII